MSKESDKFRKYIQNSNVPKWEDLTEYEKQCFAQYYGFDYETKRKEERLQKLGSILEDLFNEIMPHNKISINNRERFRKRALEVLEPYITL